MLCRYARPGAKDSFSARENLNNLISQLRPTRYLSAERSLARIMHTCDRSLCTPTNTHAYTHSSTLLFFLWARKNSHAHNSFAWCLLLHELTNKHIRQKKQTPWICKHHRIDAKMGANIGNDERRSHTHTRTHMFDKACQIDYAHLTEVLCQRQQNQTTKSITTQTIDSNSSVFVKRFTEHGFNDHYTPLGLIRQCTLASRKRCSEISLMRRGAINPTDTHLLFRLNWSELDL